MANSSYLSKVVEPFVVQWVSAEIGVDLKPQRVAVGTTMHGRMVHFMFDGVSEDGKTGLLVSTSHTLKPGGTRKLFNDAAILLNTPFERRIMAFVNDAALKNFINKCDGLLPLRKIEMHVCNCIPEAMALEIANFQSLAKTEVGDKGKIWKLGKQRR
jgi:hypothetical protein